MPTLAEELLEEIDTALEEVEVSIQLLQYDLSAIRPPAYLPEEFFSQVSNQLQTTEGTLQLACTFNDIGGYAKDIATVTGLLSAGPPGIILAAIKVTNQTLGILVGLYQNSQRWGVEINKSLTSRIGDYVSVKLHEKKIKGLKMSAGNSVWARSFYMAEVNRDLLKFQSTLADFRNRRDALLARQEEARETKRGLEDEIRGIFAWFDAQGPMHFELANLVFMRMEVLEDEYNSINYQIDRIDEELNTRGARSIREIEDKIAAIEADMESVRNQADNFEDLAQQLGFTVNVAEEQIGTVPSDYIDTLDLINAVKETVDDVSNAWGFALDAKGWAERIFSYVQTAKQDVDSWQQKNRSITTALSQYIDNTRLKKLEAKESWEREKLDDPESAKTNYRKFIRLSMEKIERNKGKASELKSYQVQMENVVLKHSKNLDQMFSNEEENIRAQIDDSVQKREALSRSLASLQAVSISKSEAKRNPVLKQIYKTVERKKVEFGAQLDTCLKKEQKYKAKVERLIEKVIREKNTCMDLLNEAFGESGDAQRINYYGSKIAELETNFQTTLDEIALEDRSQMQRNR